MSNTTDAWKDLYDAQTDAVGQKLTATVGNVIGRAIFHQNALDQILAPGGLAEAGGFEFQMLAEDFAQTPDKFIPVLAQGVELQVVNVNVNNGILYITAGDPVSTE